MKILFRDKIFLFLIIDNFVGTKNLIFEEVNLIKNKTNEFIKEI